MTRTNFFTFGVPKIIFYIGLLCGCILNETVTDKTIYNYEIPIKPRVSHRQKQLLKSIHLPEISFEVYGEFPTIKHFDLFEDEITSKYKKMSRFLNLREKRDLQNSEETFLSDKHSVLIKSRIHSPLKNWDDKLTDPQSKIYKLLSTSYCEFLLQSFRHANTSQFKQPKCTFIEFTKGSIILNAILTFNEANYSLLSSQDLSNLLIKGSEELINSIINDKNFSLGFNFNGDFSFRLTEIKEESTVLLPTSQPLSSSSSSSSPLSITTMTTTITMADANEMYSYMRSSMDEIQSSVNFSSDFMDTEQSLASTLSYGETIDTTTYSVALNFTIQGTNSSLTWDDDLLNTTSTTYQELSRNVCELLLAAMRSILSSLWIVECGTIKFRKGSIDVDAELILIANSSSFVTTLEPTSTVLNDTNIIEGINEYVSTVDQNNTFGIYIDPNSSISLSLITISMESTIPYDDQVISDVISSETSSSSDFPVSVYSTSTGDVSPYDSAVSSMLTRSNKSLEWNDSLLDPSSDLYRNYSAEICNLLLDSIYSTYIEGIINVNCTVVGFSRGSVVGNAVLVIDHSSTSGNFSSTEVTKDTVRNAVVAYIAEMVANGSEQVYFDTSSGLTVETVIDVATTEVITESQNTEDNKTTAVSSMLTRSNKSLEWNDSLLDPSSDLYRNYSAEICNLIKASPRYITSIQYTVRTCTVLRFYPGSVKSDVQIIVEYVNDLNVTQTQILQAIQLGSQLYVIDHWKCSNSEAHTDISVLRKKIIIVSPKSLRIQANRTKSHHFP
ncbi:uncharacterized protein DC041_0009635 [Schistosoma bovis]|uniref:SEA domain-containing protein n=1 Tax=Schistosoma bovis TaxID=6184 RepID=A0A430QAJ8_SCHBO|nr:uncharacterized protein DC041_0009635 [Schistosoma bovis]